MQKMLDTLGINDRRWNIADTIRVWPKDTMFGAFGPGWTHDFCTDTKNAAQMYEHTDTPGDRHHMWWDESGRHQLPDPSFITKWAPHYQNFALKYPGKLHYLSPACEYNSQDTAAITHLVQIIQHLAPACIPVLCPMGGAVLPIIPNTKHEQHGTKAHAGAQAIASTDGNSIMNIASADWVQRNSGALATGLWDQRFNLAESGVMATPDARTASPDGNYILEVFSAFNPKPAPHAPTFTNAVRTLVKPSLYKVLAEDMPGDQIRDNKPLVWLSKQGKIGDLVEIVTFDGQHICNFKFFDADRAYSGTADGLWAYQIGDKAVQLSGSSTIYFKYKGIVWGPEDGYLRGDFYDG